VIALRRAFLAVVPPPAVLDWTESVVDAARRTDDGLRWTRPDQRHVTLQFLGRVDATAVDALAESVAAAVRRIPAFGVQVGGAGAFPSAQRASVLWLGIAEGADTLGALAAAVAGASAPLGVATDDRPYRPHVTLARTSGARDVRAVVERLGTGPAAPRLTVTDVILFDSDTRPDGAVHTEHARFALDAAR
jgi:2'-5' RNA ligase